MHEVFEKRGIMNKDLTVGNPQSVLWKFCLPLFGSIIFQQLYNIADSLVAGKFIGENALAAVGNSYEITLIFIAFAFGCNMGCSVITSLLFGEKNYKDMKTAILTSMITSAVTCFILMGLGFLFSDMLLGLIKTPIEILKDSTLYLNIYILGLPFLFFYNLSTGIFSALGDSKTPFIFLAISSTSNIIVDILFVSVFSMGVAGVAWATFICQGISCILALGVILNRINKMKIGKVPCFSVPLLKKFLGVAIPSTLQQSFVSVGNIIIQGVINGFGSGVIAGYSAAIKLNNLVITSFTTLGNGISNYTAQNLGANKMDRIKDGFKAGIKMVWILCIPIILLYLSQTRTLIHFFMDHPSTLAMKSSTQLLYIIVPFYFVVSSKLVSDGVLRGASLMKPFMIGTFTDLILRVALAIVLSRHFGYVGIWMAWPIGWSVSTMMSIYFYSQGPWKNESRL